MENNSVLQDKSEGRQEVSSLLAAGDIECDKCGKMIKHLDRYCCTAHECPICGGTVDTIAELDGHFSQQHPRCPSRGTRYCVDCSLKAGFLMIVKNKKTGSVFPAMFALRDEAQMSE